MRNLFRSFVPILGLLLFPALLFAASPVKNNLTGGIIPDYSESPAYVAHWKLPAADSVAMAAISLDVMTTFDYSPEAAGITEQADGRLLGGLAVTVEPRPGSAANYSPGLLSPQVAFLSIGGRVTFEPDGFG